MSQEKKNAANLGFNKQFSDFMKFVQSIFPDDFDITTMINALSVIQSNSPTVINEVWYKFITSKYGAEIDCGDVNFFFDKDYSTDVQNLKQGAFILEKINDLRQFVKNMNSANQQQAMKYIQKLHNLCKLYHS